MLFPYPDRGRMMLGDIAFILIIAVLLYLWFKQAVLR